MWAPPPAGGTLFARAYLIACCGGARLAGSWVCMPHELAGRRADGGSPPASTVSIDVHDLLQEVCGRAVVIPQHGTVKRGTLGSILRQAGVTPAEFLELL